MRILGAIVEPVADLLAIGVADLSHRRRVSAHFDPFDVAVRLIDGAGAQDNDFPRHAAIGEAFVPWGAVAAAIPDQPLS